VAGYRSWSVNTGTVVPASDGAGVGTPVRNSTRYTTTPVTHPLRHRFDNYIVVNDRRLCRASDTTASDGITMPLGEFEQLLRFALVRLKGEAQGAAIAEAIEVRTGRTVSPGALYTALDRMEAKGWVASWIGSSTPERGGRRRKVYRMLPTGARELRGSYEHLGRMASAALPRLDALAEEG